MKWSPQQDQALKAVGRWLDSPDSQVFYMAGYAGTGKTTLARHLADGIAGVQFAAYTGKAAYVLQQKGCYGAQTIHQLIYTPKGKSAERLRAYQRQLAALSAGDPDMAELERKIAAERDNLKRPAFALNPMSALRTAPLVIIDECSMVDERIGTDLLSFGCKVLVLGDPAQLPPVRGAGFFTKRQPDVLLTEIHRQAAGSPIIQMATTVREGGRLMPGTYGESQVITDLTPDVALAADQIIVGMNKTRRRSNARVRELRGFQGVVPCEGERLVCLRNNHEEGLLNGSLWTVDAMIDDDDPVVMSLKPEDGDWRQDVTAHRCLFEGDDVEFWAKRDADEFEFGYALTGHKSQGSQWDHVLVVDESAVFRQDARRWLYTAITRAAKKVVVKQ